MTDNTQKGMDWKFGTLKAYEAKTAASGTEFGDVQIDAGKFTVYARVFDAGVKAAIAAATIGDKIRIGGFTEKREVETAEGKRVFNNLVVRWVSINDGEGVKATLKADVPAAEEAAA